MLPFLTRRLIVAAFVALAVSAVAFGLMFVSGDPAVVLAGQAGRPTAERWLRPNLD